jgi:hypothetical protein
LDYDLNKLLDESKFRILLGSKVDFVDGRDGKEKQCGAVIPLLSVTKICHLVKKLS